jgi:hypothetical protein
MSQDRRGFVLTAKLSNLPYFDDKSLCPKCGCKEVRAVYQKEQHYYADRDYRCRNSGHPEKEHIDRICSYCGYFWAQRCLDEVNVSVTMSPNASQETVEALGKMASLAVDAMRKGKL